jgi:hypothetical protein
MKVKIVSIKTDLRGTEVSKNHYLRGAQFEQTLSKLGFPVTAGVGPDYPEFDLEVKTKDKNSRSANGVGSMRVDDIISTSYEDSPVAKKLQHQYRITSDNGLVISNKIYDFTDTFIQSKLKTAYKVCQTKMRNGDRASYIYGSEYGYFEKKTGSKNSWVFRITVGAMKKIEKLSDNSSQFNTLFNLA